MFKTALFAILAAVVIAGAASARQSTIVIGESAAARCYQNALYGRSDQSALADCDMALESGTTTRSDRQKTYVNRAIVYLNMDREEMALEDLEQARRMNPETPEIYLNLSAAYVRLGRNVEAIAAATEALERGYGEAHRAYYNRAAAYENAGNYAAAYQDLREAARLAPEWPAPRRELERFSVANLT